MRRKVHKTTLKLFQGAPVKNHSDQSIQFGAGSKQKEAKTPELLSKEQYACDVATD